MNKIESLKGKIVPLTHKECNLLKGGFMKIGTNKSDNTVDTNANCHGNKLVPIITIEADTNTNCYQACGCSV